MFSSKYFWLNSEGIRMRRITSEPFSSFIKGDRLQELFGTETVKIALEEKEAVYDSVKGQWRQLEFIFMGFIW